MVLVPDDVQDMRDKRILGNSIAPKDDPLVVIYDRSLSRSFVGFPKPFHQCRSSALGTRIKEVHGGLEIPNAFRCRTRAKRPRSDLELLINAPKHLNFKP